MSWTDLTHVEMMNDEMDHLIVDWNPSGVIVTILNGRNYGMERFELSKEHVEELKKVLR
jgi:hypothetical protein